MIRDTTSQDRQLAPPAHGRRWVLTAAAVALAALALITTLAFSRRLLRTVLSLFRALSGTVGSYRDNDFSFGIVWNGNDELGDLVAAHNALGAALREQRLTLVQRELLLDTMVQNTPVDAADRAGRPCGVRQSGRTPVAQ